MEEVERGEGRGVRGAGDREGETWEKRARERGEGSGEQRGRD